MAVKGQVTRLTALAIATGTLVATGAGTASAVAAVDTSRMAGSGDGYALKLTINLPDALSGVLGKTIEQTISLTDGKVSNVGTPMAVTSAVLGKGTTPVLSDLLNRTTAASLDAKSQDTSAGPVDINQPGLQIRLLPLLSKVAQPSLDGVIAESDSAVAHINIGGLGALPASLDAVKLPVAATLNSALSTATNAGGTAAPTVANTLNGAISQLNAATNNTAAPLTAPAQAAVNSAVSTLTSTLSGLTDTLGSLNAASNLVTLDAVTSNQTITRSGKALTSDVTNTVKNLNVLNGLVKIEAITSEATATAGGVPGSAVATTHAPVLKVDVANGALTALLDEHGLNVGGTVGSALPAGLQDTVNGALATVNGLLNQLAGINVVIGKGTTTASPDGSAAAATVAATTVTIDPPVLHTAGLLAADKKFLTLDLVRANAAVGSQVVAAPVDVAKSSAATPSVTHSLPRTGASLPLTGAVATLLVGAALVVRRRRSVFSA
ncbi:MAG: hypothetical protein M3N21_02240 [Actinomycetota bacterium]|nr:hypothetical protein [Actinomycetota bacterium]